MKGRKNETTKLFKLLENPSYQIVCSLFLPSSAQAQLKLQVDGLSYPYFTFIQAPTPTPPGKVYFQAFFSEC
jgi:hypothetical protein